MLQQIREVFTHFNVQPDSYNLLPRTDTKVVHEAKRLLWAINDCKQVLAGNVDVTSSYIFRGDLVKAREVFFHHACREYRTFFLPAYHAWKANQ